MLRVSLRSLCFLEGMLDWRIMHSSDIVFLCLRQKNEALNFAIYDLQK